MPIFSFTRSTLLRIIFGLATTASAVAQAPPGPSSAWTVRPEWVRAHEEFLASDTLAGRGSATRDEEIAASYIASRFLAYGLKPAPGATAYIQSADIVSPILDGAATLKAGAVTLHEGPDFRLLMSSATTVTGPLKKIPATEAARSDPKAAIVLATGDPKAAMTGARSLVEYGAAAVLVTQSPASDTMFSMVGGKTRVPIRLKESPPRRTQNVVLLTPDAVARLAAQPDGTPIELAVHEIPPAKPRQTFNAIGYLEGTDPSAGYILLTAHLDHLGVGKPVDGDAIFNGANDDAAGTTAVLELAHALAAGPKPRRGILFVCYGSEEAGTLGSTFFGAHPPVPLTSLVANLEFEMIGNQDPKMPKGVLLLTGWERSNLGPALKQHGALVGPDPYPEQHFFERSDNYSLALKGVVAHTAAGWGTPPTYHQPSDDIAHLDFAFMTAAIQSLIEPVRWLASSDFKPEWNKGGQPQPRKP